LGKVPVYNYVQIEIKVSVCVVLTLEYQGHHSCLCCIYFAYQTIIKPYAKPECNPLAKFIVPDWEDVVDSVIGLSYRPVRLYSLAGRYNNPNVAVYYIPQSGTMNLATVNINFLDKPMQWVKALYSVA
jgi:hypothetical protein